MPDPLVTDAMSADPLGLRADADARLAPIEDEPAATALTSSAVRFTGHVWDIRQDAFDYNGAEIVREYVRSEERRVGKECPV